MPMVPLPEDCRIILFQDWLRLGESLFGADKNGWTFLCMACGKVFTKAEATKFWKARGEVQKTARWCHECGEAASTSGYPGHCYRILAAPSDFPHRTDIPEQGITLPTMPFFHDRLDPVQIRQIVFPFYPIKSDLTKSAVTPAPPIGFDLTHAPNTPQPITFPNPTKPEPKKATNYGFQF